MYLVYVTQNCAAGRCCVAFARINTHTPGPLFTKFVARCRNFAVYAQDRSKNARGVIVVFLRLIHPSRRASRRRGRELVPLRGASPDLSITIAHIFSLPAVFTHSISGHQISPQNTLAVHSCSMHRARYSLFNRTSAIFAASARAAFPALLIALSRVYVQSTLRTDSCCCCWFVVRSVSQRWRRRLCSARRPRCLRMIDQHLTRSPD